MSAKWLVSGVIVAAAGSAGIAHRSLKSRAALAAVSLTEYARQTLEAAALRRSRDELIAEFSSIEPADTGESAAQTVAEARREYE